MDSPPSRIAFNYLRNQQPAAMHVLSRRQIVAGCTTLIAGGLAGCTGDGGGDGGDGTEDSPSPTQTDTDGGEFAENERRVVDFLTSEPATDNFQDTFDDLGGEATVRVGAQGNEGNFAFDPPAARLSTGTTVTWKWTGEGGEHNVSTTNDSDFEFSSGDPIDSAEETFQQTFDEAGVALYICEPHQSLGMKGGIVIEEG